jgi:ubiquinone/menaquinone biosynthesis C-methylase UbiE
METYETPRQFVDLSAVRFQGSILDVGGGGEGIISRHSRDRVIAIDKHRSELEETPDVGLKIVMDACDLGFLDRSFDNVTCFYSLMYMTPEDVGRAIREAYRVLKPNGLLWIWDVTIPPAPSAEIFIASLKVKVSDSMTIATGYGVRWDHELSLKALLRICRKTGFIVEHTGESDQSFSLQLRKPMLFL